MQVYKLDIMTAQTWLSILPTLYYYQMCEQANKSIHRNEENVE